MADYRIRRFEDADLSEVLEVMRLSLGESEVNQRTEDLFSWKHFRNPFGRSMILVAESGGRIAGLRAFLRWELETPGGGCLRGVRPVDTATHPDFRRMGIFEALTKTAIEEARGEGVDLIFNTPNPQSGAGYLKMGWKEVGPIGVMIRLQRPFLPKIEHDDFDRARLLAPAVGSPVLIGPVRAPGGLRTPRTADYLRWRYSEHPTAGYRVVAYHGGRVIIRPNIRNRRGEVVVSDILGTASAAGFRAATRQGRGHYLVSWFSPGSPERRAALRAGFLPVPRVRALTLVAKTLTDLDIDVFDPTGWDLAVGDLELL